MEGPSNGGMLYHEVQESKLCAVHCVNTVLQGPFFSEFDLAAVASDLDRKERQMMLEGGGSDFVPGESHNVSLDGDFSIQVLEKALEVWDLQVIPLNCPVAEPAQIDPELENAFICHLQDHWFCIRKVDGEWYNFDSLYAAPEHLSKFYLSAYLDSLKGFGWSIFLVKGNFPKEYPMTSSEASNGYGQWLLPEDAEGITKSRNSERRETHRTEPDQELQHRESEMLLGTEDEDLKAAIAASLMDSSPATASAEASTSQSEVGNTQSENKNSSEATHVADPNQEIQYRESEMLLGAEEEDLKAAIAASLMDSSPATATAKASSAQSEVGTSQSENSAAIAASLMDSSPATATATAKTSSAQSEVGTSQSENNAAIAASLMDSSPATATAKASSSQSEAGTSQS